MILGKANTRMTFDTCFLIDLQRERRKRTFGSAHQFLQPLGDHPVSLSAAALGEFALGFALPDDPTFRRISSHFHLLPIDRQVALRYGVIARALIAQDTPIGKNDLWIAATALQHGLPLVTRDLDHFRRVPGLELIGY